MSRLRELVGKVLGAYPQQRADDLCVHALDGITLPFDLP
jgi:hypothetical protein